MFGLDRQILVLFYGSFAESGSAFWLIVWYFSLCVVNKNNFSNIV